MIVFLSHPQIAIAFLVVTSVFQTFWLRQLTYKIAVAQQAIEQLRKDTP